jgi:predicted DNA-binding transcriptional regulator AlpA
MEGRALDPELAELAAVSRATVYRVIQRAQSSVGISLDV